MKKILITTILIGSAFFIAGCGSNATETTTTTTTTESTAEKESQPKKEKYKLDEAKFVTDNKLELKAIDVEYDMSNKIDQNFLVAGNAELDDYFNYNYRDSADSLFCVRVEPTGNDAGDYWYVYFDREEHKDLFDVLKQGPQEVLINAVVSGSKHQEGMGNLADGVVAEFDKSILENTAKESKTLTDFKAANNITTNAIDIMFNAENNLDTPFALEGEATISDYFNYNYRGKEKEYFNVTLRPTDNSSDYWHLYFDREDHKDLFEKLKTGNANITVQAVIPSSTYEDGMNTMALAEKVQIN
ncbi:MAG: hypothetical protein ACRCTZ_07295 [Sarcina sp.]